MMDNFMAFFAAYWWILPILILLFFYEFIFRFFFGMVIVPEDKIGLVTKKFVLTGAHRDLPDGRIIATNGEAGYQVDPLPPGIKWGYWPWQYDVIFRPFTIVQQGKISLVSAKDGAQLTTGRILARGVECDNFQDARAFLNNGGQKGKQVKFLTTGIYRINTLLFDVEEAKITTISEGKVGIITTQDGEPLNEGNIAGLPIKGHNNFQDFDQFLINGGQRGLQTQYILAGSYALNPWAVTYQEVNMVEVPIGSVAVVTSFVGEEGVDLSGIEFKHGNIVANGHKGIWAKPYNPGKYPINPYTTKLEIVQTTNLVLNWANARSESHNLDKNLSTIVVRSKDGFTFNLDVSQIIHIPADAAPKVIARFGSVLNLVSQVLEPTIGNYFRNSAQSSDVISFLGSRKTRQDEAKAAISAVLEGYDVHAVDTLIGDIVPPETLMKTLTDRKLAEEQLETYDRQEKSQIKRQSLESSTALANMQGELIQASQSIIIAENRANASIKEATGKAEGDKIRAAGEAEATKSRAGATAFEIKSIGESEAGKILAIGKSTAEAYKLQADAMGREDFGRLKVVEAIGKGDVNVMPQVYIQGGNGNSDGASGAMSGLLGLKLLEQVGNNIGNSEKKVNKGDTNDKA